MQPKNTTQPNIAALTFGKCLAKTFKDNEGKILPGHKVFEHCKIVGNVAEEILKRIPQNLKNELFPEGSGWIAAVHDIGKVSPTFQEKLHRAITGYENNSLKGLEDKDLASPEREKDWGGHAGVSKASLVKFLKLEKLDEEKAKLISGIAGVHHGYATNISRNKADACKFGGESWEQERRKLTKALLKEFGEADRVISSLKGLTEAQARCIAGLTSVSDWIGSGTYFEDPEAEWDAKTIKDAVNDAGFVPIKFKKGLSFEDIFKFVPNTVQTKLVENFKEGGVYVLEAPMGVGKTEAALYATYKLMSEGLATGMYFALPTQLTSDIIHHRVNAYLTKILDEKQWGKNIHKEAFLIHSNCFFDNIGEDGTTTWFSSAKRAILAPFGVGTIDQVLMSVMNVKHGFVRTFGLVGKVIILDEVHSYDAYTGTILQELVKQLLSLKCTVIILSATLTGKKTVELLKVAGARNFTADKTLECPLITFYAAGILNYVPIENPNPSNKVSIELIDNDERAIDEVLELAERKLQVLWIENSVQEAQETYQKISARSRELNIECGLLHSRFLKCHRSQNEEIWVKKFGKDCNDAERYERGRILIGTQVLEQSLDIDADFLVTRFCPTDMLLQRLGRLWRHQNRQRPKSSSCRAWVLEPKDLNIKDPFGITAKIYDEYILHRSYQVWRDLTELVLPDGIRHLIEETYREKEYPDSDIGRLKHKSKTKQENLKSKALFSLSGGAETLEEKESSTRYFEHETTECLIIREMDKTQKGCKVVFLDGQELELPSNIKRTDRKSWKNKVLRLHDNIIRIPEDQSVKTNIKDLQNLREYLYIGESDVSELRVVKAKEYDSLVSLDNEPTSFKYCKVMGYRKYKEK